jgi:hypothetical protein
VISVTQVVMPAVLRFMRRQVQEAEAKAVGAARAPEMFTQTRIRDGLRRQPALAHVSGNDVEDALERLAEAEAVVVAGRGLYCLGEKHEVNAALVACAVPMPPSDAAASGVGGRAATASGRALPGGVAGALSATGHAPPSAAMDIE